MAWTTPSSLSTGTLVTAAEWNNSVVGNPIALRAGAVALTSQAAGDVIVASSTTQLGRVAPGTSGNVLTSNGSAWTSAAVATATSLDTGTVAYSGRTITVDTGGSLDVVLAASAGDDFTVDTTRLVVSGDETAVGINTAAPVSLLDVRGPTGTGAAPAGLMTLATNELTIVDNDQLGRIDFRSPIATAGTDAIVTAASIWSEANATFSASVNSADIVLATSESGSPVEHLRLDSRGTMGFGYEGTGKGRLQNESWGTVWGNNTYYTGSAWVAVATGISSNITLGSNGEMLFRQAPSVSAGASTTDATRLTLGTTGNFGIAETAPNDPLHITTGSAGAVTMIRLQHDNSSTNDAVSIDANMTSGIPNTSGQINFERVGTNAATDTIFSQTNTTGGLTERMRIRHDGLVGIGVTAPDRQLEVVTSGDRVAGFNSTATNGGTIEYERSGTRRVVIGTQLLCTGGGSNDNGFIGGSHSGDGGQLLVFGNYNQAGSGVYFGNGATYPALDANSYFGTASYRWHTLFASTGTINTSDEREKRDIVDSSLGLDFIDRLRPVSYRWRDPVGIKTGDTQFFGMTAQDVDEVAPPGTAFVSKENPDSWGLSYGEFTAPMIKAIQELSSRVQELEASPPSA